MVSDCHFVSLLCREGAVQKLFLMDFLVLFKECLYLCAVKRKNDNEERT